MVETLTNQLEPYLANLRALPFVRGIGLETLGDTDDVAIAVETEEGTQRFLVEAKRSPLNYAIADRALARFRAAGVPGILFAPHIAPPMARYLSDRGASLADAAGNCHLAVGTRYVAHIEGRKPERVAERRTVRATGYRVLFALLARPELVRKPVRALAEAAGVGKSAAAEMLLRLEEEGAIARSGDGRELLRPAQLMDRWLVGYGDVLRPRLMVGRFAAAERDPVALEQRIEEALTDVPAWTWGGGAAAFRLTRHFRGDETVLHVSDPPADLARRLRLLPARDGRVTIVRPPGPVALEGAQPRTAHPLLVYTELMTAGDEREREAAVEILERYLPALK